MRVGTGSQSKIEGIYTTCSMILMGRLWRCLVQVWGAVWIMHTPGTCRQSTLTSHTRICTTLWQQMSLNLGQRTWTGSHQDR